MGLSYKEINEESKTFIIGRGALMAKKQEASKGKFTMVPNWVLRDDTGMLDCYDKVILVILMSYTNPEDKKTAWLGINRLKSQCSCSSGRVTKSLKRLESIGLINIERRGRGRTNVYHLSDFTMLKWPPEKQG